MDGYAVKAADAMEGARLSVVGTASAGHAFAGRLRGAQAVRIFTGAPVPDGADAVVIQENTSREGDVVAIGAAARPGQNIRRTGLDFAEGMAALEGGTFLGPRDLALAAAANHGRLVVRRRPRVAILATGDEIVPPGSPLGPSQIVASNNYALAAMAAAEGASVIDLGIAGDEIASLEAAVLEAREAGADVLVTIGGASVGDHDLVQTALRRQGMALGFWKIAMRPGKPMMHGRLGPMQILGLPGNPVSAVVCGILFLVPLIRALLGRRELQLQRTRARLAHALPANDWREDYLRARLEFDPSDAAARAHVFEIQDSSMVSILRNADCLLVRPPQAPAAAAGDVVDIIDLRAAGL
jgi:molybdopterin molybdotransferase